MEEVNSDFKYNVKFKPVFRVARLYHGHSIQVIFSLIWPFLIFFCFNNKIVTFLNARGISIFPAFL